MVREHLRPLREVVVGRLAEDTRLAIDENSERDAEFMHDLLPLLALSPRRHRGIPIRHERWCDALALGGSDGLEFSEVEESRIALACLAVRTGVAVDLIDTRRVDDLLAAVAVATKRRATAALLV